MGPKAELGPIDTTMNTPYNPTHPKTGETLPISVEDVMGYFRFWKKLLQRSEGKIEGLKEFTQKGSPVCTWNGSRLEDQTRLVAGQMLASRLKPFTMQRMKQLLPRLQNGSTVIAIRFRVAKPSNKSGYRMCKRPKTSMWSLIWDLYLTLRKTTNSKSAHPEDEFWKDDNLETKEHLASSALR